MIIFVFFFFNTVGSIKFLINGCDNTLVNKSLFLKISWFLVLTNIKVMENNEISMHANLGRVWSYFQKIIFIKCFLGF